MELDFYSASTSAVQAPSTTAIQNFTASCSRNSHKVERKTIVVDKDYSKFIDGLPPSVHDLLIDLSVAEKLFSKICYLCKYSLFKYCYITRQRSKRLQVFSMPSYLPDVELINEFDLDLLYGNKKSNNVQFDDEDTTVQQDKTENITILKNKKCCVERKNILHDTSDTHRKQFDRILEYGTITGDYNEIKKALEYFGLISIDDLFSISDTEACTFESNGTSLSHFPVEDVVSIHVNSDSESNMEENNNYSYNAREEQRKRQYEFADISPKSKKVKRHIADTASNGTNSDIQMIIGHLNYLKENNGALQRELSNDSDDGDYESDSTVILTPHDSDNHNSNVQLERDLFISDDDETFDSSPSIKSKVMNVEQEISVANNEMANNCSMSPTNRSIAPQLTKNSNIPMIKNNVPVYEISDIDSDSEINEGIAASHVPIRLQDENCGSKEIHNALTGDYDNHSKTNKDNVYSNSQLLKDLSVSASDNDSQSTQSSVNTSEEMTANIASSTLKKTMKSQYVRRKKKQIAEMNILHNVPDINSGLNINEVVNAGNNITRLRDEHSNFEAFGPNSSGTHPLIKSSDVQFTETKVLSFAISDTDSDSETNVDIVRNKVLGEEMFLNEYSDVIQENLPVHTQIKHVTTLTLSNNSDVQIIETELPCVTLSDTDSDVEENGNMESGNSADFKNNGNTSIGKVNDETVTDGSESDLDMDDDWLQHFLYIRY